MRLFALLLILIACVAAATEPGAAILLSAERPIVNVPTTLRQANWLGSKREGSCSFAALCTALNWENQSAKSSEIRQSCGNGQSPRSLAIEMAKREIPFAWTFGDNDVEFLDQAMQGRRGVMVAVDFGDPNDDECHMVLLSHLDAYSACLIDNNNPSQNQWMTRNEFINEWCETGSWAVVPLAGPPTPPLVQR